jgi:hypothetical protein
MVNRIFDEEPQVDQPVYSMFEFVEAALMIYLGMVDKGQIPVGTALANSDPQLFRNYVRGCVGLADKYLQSETGQKQLEKLRQMVDT